MNALAWQERAACRAYGSGDFFSDSRIRINQAKRVCSVCPVRRQCLEMALRAEHQSRYGVFGGLTGAERQQLVKQMRKTGASR